MPIDEVARKHNQVLNGLCADNFTFLGLREYRFWPTSRSVETNIERAKGLHAFWRDPMMMIRAAGIANGGDDAGNPRISCGDRRRPLVTKAN